MLDHAEERERLAEARALEWCNHTELAARMLRNEEEHTHDARAALHTAKDLQRCEQAARQMVELLLATTPHTELYLYLQYRHQSNTLGKGIETMLCS